MPLVKAIFSGPPLRFAGNHRSEQTDRLLPELSSRTFTAIGGGPHVLEGAFAVTPIPCSTPKSSSADGLFSRSSADGDFEVLQGVGVAAKAPSRTWEPPPIAVNGKSQFPPDEERRQLSDRAISLFLLPFRGIPDRERERERERERDLSPGLLSPGLLSPGLLSPGLLSPGLLSPGLLSPGLSATEKGSRHRPRLLGRVRGKAVSAQPTLRHPPSADPFWYSLFATIEL